MSLFAQVGLIETSGSEVTILKLVSNQPYSFDSRARSSLLLEQDFVKEIA
jgi:hypothetical protein